YISQKKLQDLLHSIHLYTLQSHQSNRYLLVQTLHFSDPVDMFPLVVDILPVEDNVSNYMHCA
ncbi:MAG: hypothetical protein ACKPKO_11775, partial [Candidatus Fonsibacter sp.]